MKLSRPNFTAISLSDSRLTIFGEKPFFARFEFVEQYIGDDGIENCIAQKFESFVVNAPTLFAYRGRTMQTGLFIQMYVGRIKT